MDSLSTQKTKPRKMKAAAKKSRVQILLDLFYRVIEITVVMVTVTKLCYQLVIMFEDSGLTRFLINRHLAFLLGNAIVIAVVAKCGLFSNQEPDAPPRNRNDFYDEFVRESSRREQSVHTDVICREKQSSDEDGSKQISEVKKPITEDKKQSRSKQSMLEDRTKQSIQENRAKQSMLENRAEQSTEDKREEQNTDKKDISVKRQRQIITKTQESPRKSYQRSGSENLESSKKSSCGGLKRSETERPAAEVSDDELRYKIESFIARQRRNQKDEEFCIV